MTKHYCNLCNYETERISLYNRHIQTKKHINNNINNNNNIQNNNISTNNALLLLQQEFKKQNEDLMKEIHKLKETNEKLNETNNKNTNKIVREAKIIKKSILTILNTNFRDAPPIEYIKEENFKIELEKEYNTTIDDPSNKLFIRIFNDYEKKKLIKTISDIILKFVKRDEQQYQSVFNIDSSRANFATKIEDFWMNDKKGLQLKKYTIDKVIQYMINILDIFRIRIVKVREDNLKKPTIDKSDFIMKYQALLLEVITFLTNTNTHTKIIFQTCPELRFNEKLLELYN
jgi:hypothetical protein